MNPEIFSGLSGSFLFKNIPAEKIKHSLNRIQYSTQTYKKGNTLVFRGKKCQELIRLIKGTVRGEMTDAKGKLIEIEIIPAPRPLAPAFIFGQHNHYPVDIIALEEVSAVFIPKTSLLSLFESNPVLLTNFLDAISNRAQFLSKKLWLMSFKTIRGKIASHVLSLLKPGENSVTLPQNQRELSEFFGVTRPSLSRVFSQLFRDNILEYKQKKIIIKSREKLIDLLEEE
jgi:CRP-like cAMP-binding protein